MSRTFQFRTLVLITAWLFSQSSQGETWDAQQQEVWSTLLKIHRLFESGDINAGYEHIHSSYKYWDTTRPAPLGYEQARRLDSYVWGQQSRRSQRVCIPLTIDVFVSFAVVNTDCRGFWHGVDGTQDYYSVRKSLVLKREGSGWLLISSTDDDFSD